MTAAVRYDIQIKDPTQKETHGRDDSADWEKPGKKGKIPMKTVEKTAKTKSEQMGRSPTEMRRQTDKTKKLRLKPGTWSEKILSEFALATNGVFLELSMETASRHARQLCGTQNQIGLVTTQALDLYKHQQRLTFVLIEEGEDGIERDKVVQGYLSSFGQTPIRYLADSQPIVSKVIPRSTMVLRARCKKTACTPKEWGELTKLTTPQQFRKYLEQHRPDLQVSDLFRIEKDDLTMSWLIRIPQTQMKAWLISDKLPFCHLPVGPDVDSFRIIWDRETETLPQIRAKYEGVPGFLGPVLAAKGNGARFGEKDIDRARQQSGLPVGTVYHLMGVPVEYQPEDVVPLLAELGWCTTLMPGWRRVKNELAQYKVRATTPPPREVLRIQQDGEILTFSCSRAQADGSQD